MGNIGEHPVRRTLMVRTKGDWNIMAGKLTTRGVEARSRIKGRYLDGDGLFLRVLDPGKRVYWVYRYRLDGKDRETSIGSHPAMTLAEARDRHIDLRKLVKDGIDPVGDRRKAKAAVKTTTNSNATTFGQCADEYLERLEKRGELGKNPKHRAQWRATLTSLPAWFRSLPVDEIGPQQVFEALDPIWTRTPETGSRLRGRVPAVLDSARGPDDMSANPAAWSDWLKKKLGDPKKLGKFDRRTGERVKRGNHAAMPYADVPALMARLANTDGAAARALRLVILTASRTSEVLGMTFEEVDFDKVVWTVPEERMKTGEKHSVPLSDAAVAILKAQHETRGRSPHIFPGRPTKPLSNMSMAMLLRRMGVEATVHGFRSSFRVWCSEIAHVEFEVAELCLSHRIGSKVSRDYNRTTMTERRRPIMALWAAFVTGADANNVIPLRAHEHA
jgi:integrase